MPKKPSAISIGIIGLIQGGIGDDYARASCDNLGNGLDNEYTLRQDNHPTDVGPFQKYLFSGACYVQIGQCYALVKQAVEQGKNFSDNEQLRSRLAAVWQSYVVQQSGAMSSAYAGFDVPDSGGQQWHWVHKLHQEVQQAGIEAMEQLLPVLEQMDSEHLDLQQFFVSWAGACDQAYNRLIRSDAFARAMGEVVNTMLVAAKYE